MYSNRALDDSLKLRRSGMVLAGPRHAAPMGLKTVPFGRWYCCLYTIATTLNGCLAGPISSLTGFRTLDFGPRASQGASLAVTSP